MTNLDEDHAIHFEIKIVIGFIWLFLRRRLMMAQDVRAKTLQEKIHGPMTSPPFISKFSFSFYANTI